MPKRLGAFESFALAEKQQEVRSLSPEVSSPAQQITRIFNFQSYFDSTLLARAILRQPPNDPIVDPKEEQITGYAIGLHPSSQTPVSIEFRVGAQNSSSGPLILKPGQVIRPYGLPAGSTKGAFSGFRWGVPFGWLGGGMATIVVFQTPDSDVSWPGDAEVIFHRARYQIVAPATFATAQAKNWPMRFPWVAAVQGTSSLPQDGKGAVAITKPTRILMSLRVGTLASSADMRMLWQASNDFDRDSAGAAILTGQRAYDYTWGSWASLGGGTQYPVVELNGQVSRLAADDGALILVDASGGTLANQYVDIVRYGCL